MRSSSEPGEEGAVARPGIAAAPVTPLCVFQQENSSQTERGPTPAAHQELQVYQGAQESQPGSFKGNTNERYLVLDQLS